MEVPFYLFIFIYLCKLFLFTPHQYNVNLLKPVICVTQVFGGSAG